MYPDELGSRALEEYKALEVELHRDLMKVCRRYINEIGIVSIMGILDIVKQEAIELERATRKNIKEEAPETETKEEANTDFSLR